MQPEIIKAARAGIVEARARECNLANVDLPPQPLRGFPPRPRGRGGLAPREDPRTLPACGLSPVANGASGMTFGKRPSDRDGRRPGRSEPLREGIGVEIRNLDLIRKNGSASASGPATRLVQSHPRCDHRHYGLKRWRSRSPAGRRVGRAAIARGEAHRIRRELGGPHAALRRSTHPTGTARTPFQWQSARDGSVDLGVFFDRNIPEG
jgi:hypothetical protein